MSQESQTKVASQVSSARGFVVGLEQRVEQAVEEDGDAHDGGHGEDPVVGVDPFGEVIALAEDHDAAGTGKHDVQARSRR